MEELWQEREGILQWLVEGAVKYFTHGLLVCPEVAAFTREYVASQDVISRWIGSLERCAPVDGLLASELVSDYQNYCRSEDEPSEHMLSADMGRKLKQRGFESKRTSIGKRYGLRRVKDASDTDTNDVSGGKTLPMEKFLAEVFAE
jgi:putative DNA primase/helicase